MESETQDTSPRSPSVGMKVAIVVVLIAVVGFVLYQKGKDTPVDPDHNPVQATVSNTVDDPPIPESPDEKVAALKLPLLLDLGSDQCIPCKMMEPVLEELKEEYQGIFDVRFINTRTDPDASDPYDIRLIPTQIFFDKEGTELFRHEGFFSKEDILKKWDELGF